MSARTVTPAEAQELAARGTLAVCADCGAPWGDDARDCAACPSASLAFVWHPIVGDLAATVAAEPARIAAAVEAERARVAHVLARLGVQDYGADPLAALESWADEHNAVAAERDAALAHAEELTRALRAAQAIVEGRTVAPTPAEAHAHNVATGRRGWWLVTTDAGTGLFALDGVDGRITYARRSNDAPWVAVDNGSDAQWSVKRAVPLDAEGRPCACPVAPEVPA